MSDEEGNLMITGTSEAGWLGDLTTAADTPPKQGWAGGKDIFALKLNKPAVLYLPLVYK